MTLRDRVYDVTVRHRDGREETVRVGANTRKVAGQRARAKTAAATIARIEYVARDDR